MPYTKSQLLTKYDIPFEAFEVIQGSDKFKSRIYAKNGLSVVSPSKEDQYALECARLTMSGFRGAPLLPYHRFLVLRFLCLPVKDVYEELINTGLLASKYRFDITYLKKIHKAMVKRAPKNIKKMFETQEFPKSDAGKKLLDTFLSIVNVRFFFNNPDRVDELSFMLNTKLIYELILTTSGANDAIAEFFSKRTRGQIPEESIRGYRVLFYAVHEMNNEHWKNYLSMVAPDERKAKTDARGKDLIGYSIEKGIQGMASMGDMLERAKMNYIRDLGNSQGFQTPAALAKQRSALDGILKIDQYQRDLGGDDTDFWKIFERFSVREPDAFEPRTIHDIREELAPKEKTNEG